MTDLQEYVLDPSKAIAKIITEINTSSGGTLELSDPTNPFINIVEIASTLTATAINEHDINMRTIFPILGVETDDLYKHISDADIIGISSIPSTINLVFGIKKVDVQALGIAHDGYKKCSIPVNTSIKIDNIEFTLLNRIDILLYDSGEINIEQNSSETGLGIDYLYILDNYIESDKDDIEWIMFQTIAKQIKREVFKETVISTKKFSYEAATVDKFFYTEVYAVNKNNTRIKLELAYNDTIFNPAIPTMYVKFLDGKVVYELPMIYQAQNLIDNTIEIILFTTKGYLNLPVEVLTSNQFAITLGDTLDLESATTKNIKKYVVSRAMLTTGKNGKNIDEIKKSIIYNTIGKIDTAISIKEKEEKADRDGFTLSLAKDTVTKRTFVAKKNLPEPTTTNINVKADLFIDTISFILDDISNKSKIGMLDNNIIIKSKNLFRFNNGVYEIMSDTDAYNISIMSKKDLMSYLNENTILYNPFYYIMEKDYNVIKSRVYDLDNPYLSELKIIGKNNHITPRANIVAMNMNITKDGYKIVYQVSGNDTFLTLRPAFIHCQLKLKLNSTIENVVFLSTMQVSGDVRYFEFNIKSNFYIDSNNGIYISGGDSNITTKSINITDNIEIVIYTTDPMLPSDTAHHKYHEYVESEDKSTLNVLTLESVKYTLGKELNYLWNDVKNFYTNKKFKKYEQDELARYSDNVYEYNPETQGIYFYVRDIDTEEVIDITTKIIHKKGDAILDDCGNNIYAHRIGDYILDSNGNLVLDGISGVVRAVDILMVDYKFYVANNNYPAYVKEYTNTITTWLDNSITSLSQDSLERTVVYYKPNKSLGSVKVISNGLTTNFSSVVNPSVTLYIKSNTDLSTTVLKDYKNIIGKIIHKHLDSKEFSLSGIKTEIISVLGENIVGIKLEDITSDNREIVKIDNDNENLFTLNKLLYLDSNNLLDLTYNINLIVERNI